MYGWLRSKPERGTASSVCGIPLDVAGTRTRYEEFSLLAAAAPAPGLAFDAGTGYIKNWHIAPYILSHLGWRVVACDNNATHLSMPEAEGVRRILSDMTASEEPASSFDLVLCISVMEHLLEEQRIAFGKEAARLAKPGATLIITADEIDPEHLITYFPDFSHGSRTADDCSDLSPRVSFTVATRD